MSQLYIGNLALTPKLKTAEYTIDLKDLTKWWASWLDGSFPDNTWKFKHHKTPLNFHAVFKNGDSLLNPKYISLLNTIKKVVFLKRSGHLADLKGKQTTRAETQYRIGRTLISFAQYIVNNGWYEEGRGFSCLTKARFDELVKIYVDGGRDAVAGYYDLVELELKKLKLEGTLNTILDNNGIFNVKAFCTVTNLDYDIASNISTTSQDKLKAYCLFQEHADSIGGTKTEFNNATPLKTTRKNNKSRKNDDDEDYIPSKVSDTSISNLVSAINALSDYQIALKEAELAHFKPFKATADDYANYYYESRRTPDIPTDIALAYIDSAVAFVHEHGDNIVNALSDCKKQIDSEMERRDKPRKDHVSKHIVIPKNSTTEHFRIKRFNQISSSSSVKEKRENVSLEIILEIYQAAVFILLATFACKRFQDVLPVKQGANTIGYTGINSIKFGLAKADPVEVLRAVGRPVPRVIAHAFDNLVEINSLLSSSPHNPSNHLFQNKLMLDGKLSLIEDKVITRDILKRRLIQFADFVEVPTVISNGLESRWYLNRMHMLRRFFACAYYSTLGKEHLPALTWLMGHTNTKQTMHYITLNLSNAEMTTSEAAGVMAAAISNLDEDEDVITTLSELFGDSTIKISLARDKRRLEKRIQELIKKGFRFIRKDSDELVMLSRNNDDEEKTCDA